MSSHHQPPHSAPALGTPTPTHLPGVGPTSSQPRPWSSSAQDAAPLRKPRPHPLSRFSHPASFPRLLLHRMLILPPHSVPFCPGPFLSPLFQHFALFPHLLLTYPAQRSIPAPFCPCPSRPTQLGPISPLRPSPPSSPFTPFFLVGFHEVPARPSPRPHFPLSPGFWLRPSLPPTPSSVPRPRTDPKPSLCPALPALMATSFLSCRGGVPQKRHGFGRRGLWRPVRARLTPLAGLALQWPLVPLRGCPGGQELGAYGRALRKQQVGELLGDATRPLWKLASRVGGKWGADRAGLEGSGTAAAQWGSVLEGFLREERWGCAVAARGRCDPS